MPVTNVLRAILSCGKIHQHIHRAVIHRKTLGCHLFKCNRLYCTNTTGFRITKPDSFSWTINGHKHSRIIIIKLFIWYGSFSNKDIKTTTRKHWLQIHLMWKRQPFPSPKNRNKQMVTSVLMAHSRQNSHWHRGVCDIAMSTEHFIKPVLSTTTVPFPPCLGEIHQPSDLDVHVFYSKVLCLCLCLVSVCECGYVSFSTQKHTPRASANA